jgi:hypothetical protein
MRYGGLRKNFKKFSDLFERTYLRSLKRSEWKMSFLKGEGVWRVELPQKVYGF